MGENVINDMTYRRGRGITVGDMVCYKIPTNDRHGSGMKRVLGMPGDYVCPDPEVGTMYQVRLLC
jgi:inner membrane protease subunit 1